MFVVRTNRSATPEERFDPRGWLRSHQLPPSGLINRIPSDDRSHDFDIFDLVLRDGK